jgi:hypothetical protein
MPRRHIPAVPHAAPRAYVDPVDDAGTAIRLFRLAAHRPWRHETLGFLLDHDGRGGTIYVVAGDAGTDDLIGVVAYLCAEAQHDPRLCSLVVASVCPDVARQCCRGSYEADRWCAASDLADEHGIELIEWFVIRPDRVECPRELAGEPERW